MVWDALLKVGDNILDSDISGKVIGAAAGGLLGSRDRESTATSQNRPYMRPEDEAAFYDGKREALDRALERSRQPYNDLPTTRYDRSFDPYEAQFQSNELLDYQQLQDSKYKSTGLGSSIAPATQTTAPPQFDTSGALQQPTQAEYLPGWDGEAYTNGMGIRINGEEGRKAAEHARINADFERVMGDSGRIMKGSHWVAPAISQTEDGRVNPFNGEIFSKDEALAGLQSGNLADVYREANNAVYDPTRSLMQRLIPAAGLAAIGAPVGAAIGGGLSGMLGATGSNIAGKAAAKLLTNGLGRVTR